jgi:hypothetical protein
VLSRSNRQDEKQPDQDDHHVGLQSGKRGGKRIREQPIRPPPRRRAAKPCAASWNVIAMIAGSAQTEMV